METEQDPLESDYGSTFICKSNICVVCALRIMEDGDGSVLDDEGAILSSASETPFQYQNNCVSMCSDVFLKGISVLCDTLNIELRFANLEDWRVPGIENFARVVCCKQCYILFGNLVTLHELIASTQASLQDDVKKIKDFMVKSQEAAKDVEYSINTCLKFREHILKKRSNLKSSHGISAMKKRFKSSRALRAAKILSKNKLRSRPSKIRKRSSKASALLDPFVKLERLKVEKHEFDEVANLHENYAQTILDDDQGSWDVGFDSPVDRNENDGGISTSPSTSPLHNDGSNKLQSDLPRKRGRPRKIVEATLREDLVSKRKRGRPRKSPLPDTSSHVKRKRGRPKKNDNDEDDEDVDKEYNPRIRLKTKKRRINMKIPKQGLKNLGHLDNSNSTLKKRGRGRPAKHIPPTWDGPKRAPIFIINVSNGTYMFLSVKIQKEEASILCKYPECNYSVARRGYFTDQAAFASMRLHIRNVHRKRGKLPGKERKNYFCVHCESCFRTRRETLRHQKSEHAEAFLPLTLCDICGEIMDHQVIFRHVTTHKNDDEMKALELFNKPNPDPPLPPASVEKVKTASKAIVSYPCNQCSKVFSTKSQQQIHMLSHIPIELRRQFICDICGDRVSSINNLKIHKKRVHFRDNIPTAYECRICGKTFLHTEKIRYQTHLNAHTGQRPFQCPQCGKGFFAKSNLNLHEKSHRETSVQCEFCPNWYKSEKYLRRHQAAHHPHLMTKKLCDDARGRHAPPKEILIGPKLMYPCEPCRQVFQYKSRLVKHLKEKHKLFLEKSEDYPNQLTLEDENTASAPMPSIFTSIHHSHMGNSNLI